MTGARLWALVGAEWRRMRSRRALRLVVLTAVVGYLIVVPAVALTQYARPDADALAEASARRDALAAQSLEQRTACLDAVPAPAPTDCPAARTAEQLGPVEQFLAKQPFLPSQAYGPVLAALLLVAAITAYGVGAHWIGSDLSSRAMTTLLTWEPRRTRVFAVRVGLVGAVTVVAGLALTAVWTATAALLATALGRHDLVAGEWAAVALDDAGRGILLMLVLALLGAGAGFLARGTAGALGAVLVELVVAELFVRNVFPSWQPWLPAVNAAALLRPNGVVVSYPEDWVDAEGNLRDVVYVAVSSGQGALLLTGLTAAVLVAAGVGWARRDVT